MGSAREARLAAMYDMPHQNMTAITSRGKEIVAHVRTLGRIYLCLRLFATVVTLAWAIMYTRALWHSRYDKDKRDRLTAINDLWLGSRSGILFTLIAHWAFTFALLILSPLLGTITAAGVEYLRASV
jgi:hypothetical protein